MRFSARFLRRDSLRYIAGELTEKDLWFLLVATRLKLRRFIFLHSKAIISSTRLYELLSTQIGKESAENLTNFIEQKINDELEKKSQILATKEDVATLKGELKTEIATSRSVIIKWMFIFWAGQVVATFGFILLFPKK